MPVKNPRLPKRREACLLRVLLPGTLRGHRRGGLAGTRAEGVKFAFPAVGVAGLAAAPSVPDEPVGEESPLLLRKEFY